MQDLFYIGLSVFAIFIIAVVLGHHHLGKSIGAKLDVLRGHKVNFDVFRNPSKYLKRLPLEEIVADTRVYRKGVERYKEKITRGEATPPIIVVKHPTKELYAVLDGHHRYYAYAELGTKEIECALAGDASRVIFYLTEHGLFQPPSDVTEHIRVPALQFNANVKQFLSDFLSDPPRIRKSDGDYSRRTRSDLPNNKETIEDDACDGVR